MVDERKLTITGVIIAVVIVIIGAVVLTKYAPPSYAPTSGTGVGTPQSGPVTRTAAPLNVTVPNAGDKSAPAGVAVPATVAPASPTGSAKLRIFNITIENNKFVPDTVAVNTGDTVHINITAVGADYDFYQPDYGPKVALARGQTNFVEFQASAAGKFIFYCVSCGGPTSGPVGSIVVVSPK